MKRNKKQEPPYISDDFQIGPYGAFEWSEDDIERMLEEIDTPSEPNYELQKALKEYKKNLRKKVKKGHKKNGNE